MKTLAFILAIVCLLLLALVCQTPIEIAIEGAQATSVINATATYGASLFQQQLTSWAATPTPIP